MPYRFRRAVFFRRSASGGFDLLGARDRAYLLAEQKFKVIANRRIICKMRRRMLS